MATDDGRCLEVVQFSRVLIVVSCGCWKMLFIEVISVLCLSLLPSSSCKFLLSELVVSLILNLR